MKIGPFSPSEKDDIVQLLKENNIKFELTADTKYLNKIISEHKGGRHFIVGNNIFWLEIENSDFNRIAEKVEKYGIVLPSDGSYELGEAED